MSTHMYTPWPGFHPGFDKAFENRRAAPAGASLLEGLTAPGPGQWHSSTKRALKLPGKPPAFGRAGGGHCAPGAQPGLSNPGSIMASCLEGPQGDWRPAWLEQARAGECPIAAICGRAKLIFLKTLTGDCFTLGLCVREETARVA